MDQLLVAAQKIKLTRMEMIAKAQNGDDRSIQRSGRWCRCGGNDVAAKILICRAGDLLSADSELSDSSTTGTDASDAGAAESRTRAMRRIGCRRRAKISSMTNHGDEQPTPAWWLSLRGRGAIAALR